MTLISRRADDADQSPGLMPHAAEHNYRLIIVDRVVHGDGRASLINPCPHFPCRPLVCVI